MGGSGRLGPHPILRATASIATALALLTAGGIAGALPPPDEIDACALLTEAEVGDYRGEAVSAKPSSAVRDDGQRIGSCMFEPATGPLTVVSVYLLLDGDPGTTDAPESWVEPLEGIGDEAWQYIAGDSRGIIPDFVSDVVARVGATHLVSVGGGTAQLLPDPGLEELLALAVERLRRLEGLAAEPDDPLAADEFSGLGGIERPAVDDDTTGALGDPVRVLGQQDGGSGLSIEGLVALIILLITLLGGVALAVFERGRRQRVRHLREAVERHKNGEISEWSLKQEMKAVRADTEKLVDYLRNAETLPEGWTDEQRWDFVHRAERVFREIDEAERAEIRPAASSGSVVPSDGAIPVEGYTDGQAGRANSVEG